MKHIHSRSIVFCLAAVLGLGNSGCSFLFVSGPHSQKSPGRIAAQVDCTSSKAAPVLDTIFGGLEVARVAYAASAPDSVYSNPNQPLSREADIGLGLGFAALFVGSAIYGYTVTSKCSEYKAGRVNDELAEESSSPAAEGTSSELP
jgi:hypothetical protein